MEMRTKGFYSTAGQAAVFADSCEWLQKEVGCRAAKLGGVQLSTDDRVEERRCGIMQKVNAQLQRRDRAHQKRHANRRHRDQAVEKALAVGRQRGEIDKLSQFDDVAPRPQHGIIL